MNDRVGNWNKTRTNYFFDHHDRVYLESQADIYYSLIFPYSLRIFKDFGAQITNTAVFARIIIFQKRVLFPIWQPDILLASGRSGKNTNISMIGKSVTHLWSYANQYTDTDIPRNSTWVPILTCQVLMLPH